MEDELEFQMNYGETVFSSMELLAGGGDTIPVTSVKGPLDAEVLLSFLDLQRQTCGPMEPIEKDVYARAMKDLSKLKTKPKITFNCRLDVIIPGERTMYTRSFRSGKGQNRYVITANQMGEPTELLCTHKSFGQKVSEFKTWPLWVIFIAATVFSAVIAGVALKLKNSPVRARMDGVLHSRMVVSSSAHDPYEDPHCDIFPEGKLY